MSTITRERLPDLYLKVDSAIFHFYPFIFHGFYDWRNIAVCSAVCGAGSSIIEVGGNVGTETVCFADIVGREGHVVALEPD